MACIDSNVTLFAMIARLIYIYVYDEFSTPLIDVYLVSRYGSEAIGILLSSKWLDLTIICHKK